LCIQSIIYRVFIKGLRTAFHLLYHQFAWSYDLVSDLVSLGQWRSWQLAAMSYILGSDILDLGHGPGHMLLNFAGRAYNPVGLDLSPQMGRIARRRLLNGGYSPNLVRGRGQSLPFAPESFDTVLATFPTPYIIAPETALAIHRVLRPGGRLVIVPEARLTGSGLLTRWLEWLFLITGQRHKNFHLGSNHEDHWHDSYTSYGFEVVSLVRQLENSEVLIVIAERPAIP
jgi:ubiquinone/menaquinone biosynthesis C-methylase UbiE